MALSFKLYENEEGIIPCRPTHPNVTMKFFKDDKDITENLEKYLLKYDPKVGLFINKASKLHHKRTIIKCEASLYKNFKESMKFSMKLFEQGIEYHIRIPRIFAMTEYPVAGNMLKYKCNLFAPHGIEVNLGKKLYFHIDHASHIPLA